MKICHYYDLAKNVKGAKCKKADIVATVVFFEAQPENKEIVNKRNKMWAYMKELTNDTKMKEYLILWN
jgi:thiamine biosynthesis lipoprotein ApbE